MFAIILIIIIIIITIKMVNVGGTSSIDL